MLKLFGAKKEEAPHMRVAIIGSRSLYVNDFDAFLPPNVTEIVSGGAIGIDTAARNYAKRKGLPIKEFLPDYDRYGRKAPLERNLQIIEYADLVLAFWDGSSRGTAYVVKKCKEKGRAYRLFLKKEQ